MALSRLTRRAARILRAEADALRQRVERFVADARAGARGSAPPPSAAQPSYHERISGYYANLELPAGAAADEVKRAYRRLVSRYHPDRHANDPTKQDAANEVARKLREAYEALLQHLGEPL